jgi:anti-anti-sigma regulatory factor
MVATDTASPRVIRMDGVFDGPAAERLASELAASRDAEVAIDLTHVREFHDFGVTVLAGALRGARRVSVRGLRQHHVRLLRYLGVETAVDVGREADLA